MTDPSRPPEPSDTDDSSETDESPPHAAGSRPPIDADGVATPPPPPAGYSPMMFGPPPRQGAGWVGRILGTILVLLLIGSVMFNVYLGFFVYGLTGGGPSQRTYLAGNTKQRIVVLPIEGLVNGGMNDFVHQAMKVLRNNPPRAIILRVNSGGGYVGAADEIWHQLHQYKADHPNIPIVASFGSTAASGAYYIAVLADVILAEPTTVTGSIGVIAPAFTFNDLLDKVGVTPEVITSTRSTKKDELNPMRKWTDADRAKLRQLLDNAYDRFVHVVAQGRSQVTKLTLEKVKKLATGEAYTLDKALKLRLVDKEGYLPDAVAAAKSKAGIAANAQPQVVWISPHRGLSLLSLLGRSDAPARQSHVSAAAALSKLSDVSGRQVRDWLVELGSPRLMYQASVR